MANLEYSLTALQKLKTLNISVSLDDFGIGTGSLACLQQTRVGALKVHNSFVRDIKANPANAAIITSIINLGKKLGTRIICEGVESLQQADALQSLNCEEVQGFWFSKPLKVDSTTELLSQNKIKDFL